MNLRETKESIYLVHFAANSCLKNDLIMLYLIFIVLLFIFLLNFKEVLFLKLYNFCATFESNSSLQMVSIKLRKGLYKGFCLRLLDHCN